MGKIMLLYPPGRAYQRGEDRAQCNLETSVVATIHACNDLGYAAAVLRNRAYRVFLRDYQTERVSMEEVKADVLGFLPDILVLSTTNGTILEDLAFIRQVAAWHSCVFILKGAIFFNTDPQLLRTLDLQQISYLIGGEIDTVIGDLADWILRGKGSVEKIPGIFYREKGEFRATDFSCWQEDLDRIPFPARDLMKNELYTRPDTGEPMATIQVSRGCPCGCSYCLTPVISGRTLRKRSIENILAELRECYYRYGIRNFFFKADTFTMDAPWAAALCEGIGSSELAGKIAFTVNTRADPRNGTLFRKLREAGCFMLAVGVESGSNDTLKRIRKGTTRQDNIRTAKLAKRAGLPLFGFFMIGFPWETEKDIDDTFSFVLQLDPDFIEVHIAMPYYGTAFYDQCLESGIITEAAWGRDYFSPNTVGTQTMPMARIQKKRERFLLRFYTRPGYLLGKIGESLRDKRILKNYLKHGMKLLKQSFSGKTVG